MAQSRENNQMAQKAALTFSDEEAVTLYGMLSDLAGSGMVSLTERQTAVTEKVVRWYRRAEAQRTLDELDEYDAVREDN